jgi:hypothetical protein
MPYHRFPRVDAADRVAAFEATGEAVVQVFTEGDQYAVFTVAVGHVERRDDASLVFRQVDAVDTRLGGEVEPTPTEESV